MEQSDIGVSERVEATTTKLEGPAAVEEAALFYLRKAQTHFGFVKERNPSRPNSIVLQRLDEAELWSERDVREKREATVDEPPINGDTPTEQAA